MKTTVITTPANPLYYSCWSLWKLWKQQKLWKQRNNDESYGNGDENHKNNDQKNVNYGDIVDDNNRNIDDLKYYYWNYNWKKAFDVGSQLIIELLHRAKLDTHHLFLTGLLRTTITLGDGICDFIQHVSNVDTNLLPSLKQSRIKVASVIETFVFML